MSDTGGYIIEFFDRYGRQLKDFKTSADGLSSAKAVGEGRMLQTAQAGIKSFKITRIIYNSLDDRGDSPMTPEQLDAVKQVQIDVWARRHD